ncbi:TPA: hypothetical protein ACXDAP_001977 [Clostridium botulinum]
MKLSKFLDKNIFIDEKETEAKYEQNKKEYCNNFIKGNDGFCEHYMGCKVDLTSCANQCEVGGIGEDRKYIKNTAAEHT